MPAALIITISVFLHWVHCADKNVVLSTNHTGITAARAMGTTTTPADMTGNLNFLSDQLFAISISHTRAGFVKNIFHAAAISYSNNASMLFLSPNAVTNF